MLVSVVADAAGRAEAGTALTGGEAGSGNWQRETGAGRLAADPGGVSNPLLLLFSSRKPAADAESG